MLPHTCTMYMYFSSKILLITLKEGANVTAWPEPVHEYNIIQLSLSVLDSTKLS